MSDARLLPMFLAVLFACSWPALAEEKPIEIPLKTIWSNTAAKARPLRDLEPEIFIRRDTPEKYEQYSDPKVIAEVLRKAKASSLVLPIEEALRNLPLDDKQPLSGFAVVGVDRAALQGVYDVLVKRMKAEHAFPATVPLSVVFLSRPTRAGVGIEGIERTGNTVRISYVLLPRTELVISSAIAIIPLGKLPPGKYHVEMRRDRSKEARPDPQRLPLIEPGAERKIICKSFDFTVKP